MWPIYSICVLLIWILCAPSVEAIANPWELDKHQILYTKKALEAVKERSWHLATYYANKVEDKEIFDFIIWLRNNLKSGISEPFLVWPSLNETEKIALSKALTGIVDAPLLSKIDKELFLKQQKVQQKLKIETDLPQEYRIKDNAEKFTLVWKKTKDIKLLYSYLKWCEKNNYIEQGLAVLITHLPLIAAVQTEPEWWTIKKLYIRDVIFLQNAKLYPNIYVLAKSHGFQTGINYAEAEWLAGWISLEFLNKPNQAYNHFYDMYNNVKMPLSKSRAAYWVGRSLYKNSSAATKWYKLAAEYNNTFYGQLALLKIDPSDDLKSNFILSDTCTEKYVSNPLLKAFYLASFLQYDKLALLLLKKLREQSTFSQIECNINQVSLKSHNPYVILQAALLTEIPPASVEHWYPVHYVKNYNNIDYTTPLVLAVIRQESAFDIYAQSVAGAQGLMQLLPSSAVRMCQGTNLYQCINTSLFTADHNVKLGRSYIEKDLKYYNGSVVLAIAAYNAGRKAVDRWVKVRGDIRLCNTLEEKINWIESIPYSETRDYVMKVLSNMQIYKSILNSNTYSIKDLEKDLDCVYH